MKTKKSEEGKAVCERLSLWWLNNLPFEAQKRGLNHAPT
jgi:hypothetical protein